MDDRLLEKFFKGQCTDAEEKEIIRWYLSGQADEPLAKKIEDYWFNTDFSSVKEWDKTHTLSALNKQIDQQESTAKKLVSLSPAQNNLTKWWYAAAILIMVMTGGWWLLIRKEKQDHIAHVQEKFIYKQTNKGEKNIFSLSDGTIVKLNSDSRFWFRENFSTTTQREVFLEGEAFFEVARDTLHPFVVHTGEINTTVLGTSFNVLAYPGDEKVAVSVVTGKVQVQQKAETHAALFLLPDEQALYSSAQLNLTKEKYDSKEVLSWKDGTLYFNDASFTEIVRTLERWYGVDIEVQHAHIKKGFSGTYTNRSLESVLEGMSFVLHFKYSIDGKKIIIQ